MTESKTRKRTLKSDTEILEKSGESEKSSVEAAPPAERKKRAYTRRAVPVQAIPEKTIPEATTAEAPSTEIYQSGFVKKYGRDKTTCKVTFTLPAAAAPYAKTVAIAGDFNKWDINVNLLEKTETGDYSITLKLDAGRDYQFKYVIDGTKWENDWNADRYEPVSGGGTDNSVVSV
ncbi:MAG: isoamylase early set domain-containing protein [Nitrospirae bacterium]|nr:isoamylase early set domain-containing protein [Nitrospirota bacterium]